MYTRVMLVHPSNLTAAYDICWLIKMNFFIFNVTKLDESKWRINILIHDMQIYNLDTQDWPTKADELEKCHDFREYFEGQERLTLGIK